jgi:hypothetical protein
MPQLVWSRLFQLWRATLEENYPPCHPLVAYRFDPIFSRCTLPCRSWSPAAAARGSDARAPQPRQHAGAPPPPLKGAGELRRRSHAVEGAGVSSTTAALQPRVRAWAPSLCPPRDGNGDPRPVNPRVKTLLGCGFGGIFAPTGTLVGENLTHRVKRVRVHSSLSHTRYPVGHPFVYDR